MDHLKLAGRYVIVRELGRGGMGIVYLARDPVLDRMVAIKTLRSQKLDAESQERFDREAKAIAQMDHPGIVQIFDVGRTDDGSFLVMSYIEGRSLRELIQSRELDVPEILDLHAQVAEALDYSHSKGIVHRDIKPENVMVFGEGEKRRAKLMDFGISLTKKDPRLTDANSIFGTLVYLSPESVLGHEIGPGSDIYSLGAVLYEALTGRLPFDGDPNVVLMKIVNADPKSLATHNSRIDPMTDALVLSCLSKSVLARPSSAGLLAEALYDHAAELRGERPSGATERRSTRRVMVGRRDAWNELIGAFQKALSGEAQLSLIEGETGIGKSTLLAELTNFAKTRGATVLGGRFVERSDPSSPFQAFGEAFGQFLAGGCADPRVRPIEVLGDLTPRLSRMFPLLADPSAGLESIGAGGEVPPTGAEALDLIALAVARMADATPVVLLLEDLHQAEVSLQALHYIYRRRPAARLHLAGTYSLGEMEAEHPLHKLLKAFSREGRVTRINLGPLTEEETGKLVERLTGAQPPAATVRVLHEVTGGNPLFVVELVNSLVESNRLDDVADSGKVEMPQSLWRLSEARIASLSKGDRDVLTHAAILGVAFSPDLLCAMDGSAGVEDRIDSLVGRRILREQGESRQVTVAFSSTLLRDALYREIPPLRRRALHRQAADLLKMRGAKRPEKVAAQLYEHLMAASDPTAAVPCAMLAARTAFAAGSYEDAQRFAACAIAGTQDEGYAGDTAVAGEAMLLSARSSDALGDVQRALEISREAAEQFATADLGSMRLEAIKLGAEIAIDNLRLDEARATASLGRREAEAAGVPALERVFTQSLNRIDALRHGGVEVATRALVTAASSARELLEAEFLDAEDGYNHAYRTKDRPAVIRRLVALSGLGHRLGRHQACLDRALDAHKVVSPDRPSEFGQLLSLQGESLLHLGRLQETLDICETGFRTLAGVQPRKHSEGEPARPGHDRLLEAASGALIAMGRHLEVADLLNREGVANPTTSEARTLVLLTEFLAQLQLPSLGLAEETLKGLEALANQSVSVAARVCCLGARLQLRKGAADQAQAEAERGVALLEDYFDTGLHTSLRLVMGQALFAQGHEIAAEEAFLIANRDASAAGARLLIIDAHLGLSATNLRSGRFRPAEVAATIACGLAARAGAGPREAESYLALAGAAAGAGNPVAAEQAVQSAREIGSKLDLITILDRCQAASVPGRPRPAL